jgi:hypothetical protein
MNEPQYNVSAIDASGCISNGWEMIKPNYWLYFGVSIVTLLMISCIPCVNIFIAGPVMGGVYFIYLKAMRNEAVDFGMMFKGFEKFVPLMIVGIVQSIPEIIAQVFRISVDIGRIGLTGSSRQMGDTGFAIASGVMIMAVIVGLIFVLIAAVWRILLMFAVPLVMDFDLSPIDAMKLSARAAMSNIGGLILLLILEFLIALLGFLAICFGFFFVLPIIYAANAFAYRQVFPWIESNFQNAPPPPASYDGGFGRGM